DDYGRSEVLNCRVPPRFASTQGLLGALASGDVAGGAEPFDDFALCIPDRNSPGERPPQTTAHTQHPVLEFEYALVPYGFVNNRCHELLVVAVNVPLKPRAGWLVGVRYEVPAAEIEHLLPIRAHAINHVGGCGHQSAEARLVVKQAESNLFPLGAVDPLP